MPTSRAGGRRDESKVKDPFSTLAAIYIPKDIKQAFRIAEKVYKSNILILRALYKLAEYPITPLKFTAITARKDDEEPDDDLELTGVEVEEKYRKIYEDYLDINRALIELNLDYFLYSNSFPILHMPFERRTVCKACLKKAKAKIPKDAKDRDKRLKSTRESLEVPIQDLKELKWVKDKFKAKCAKCKGMEQEYMTRDIPDRNNYAGISTGRLNLFRMEIQELEFSGSRRYLYTVSEQTKKNINVNDIFTLSNEPMVVLKAVGARKKVEYFSHSIFHFKMPSPIFEKESPWAWPLLVSAFQIIFFINTLRRAAEAIAQEHINPKTYIAPAKELDSLLAKFDMKDIREMIEEAYEESQYDDNRVAIMPMPVTAGILNQQGRAFLPQREIDQGTKELLTGLGIAEGLLTGQGPFAANSIAVRILENGFLSQRDMTQRYIEHTKKTIQEHFSLPPCEVEMTDFRKLDDSLHKQLVGEAVDKKLMSIRTYVKELGYKSTEEREQVKKEIKDETEYQAEMEAVLESKRAEMMTDSENVRAAKDTERRISEMEKMTDSITTMIDGLINRGYSKEWAMNYVNQYMAQQTAMSERDAAMARSMEAEQAFMMDRMGNATTGLNRAKDKMRMHQAMDQAVQDPAMQMMSEEQGSVGEIVQRTKLMNDDDRKRFLDEMQARNPTLHQQVVTMLGSYPSG